MWQKMNLKYVDGEKNENLFKMVQTYLAYLAEQLEDLKTKYKRFTVQHRRKQFFTTTMIKKCQNKVHASLKIWSPKPSFWMPLPIETFAWSLCVMNEFSWVFTAIEIKFIYKGLMEKHSQNSSFTVQTPQFSHLPCSDCVYKHQTTTLSLWCSHFSVLFDGRAAVSPESAQRASTTENN